jgi:DNA modification methylase
MAKKRTNGRAKPLAGASTADPPFAVPDWPATTPKLLPLREIIPYERNPRTHPPEQIALLAKLMKDYGVDQPIVVDEAGVILKGHGRLLAAQQAGFETFPVAVHRGLDENSKRAIRIADNQVALLSGWDSTLIGGELAELKASGFDMPLLGFPEAQLIGWGISSGTEGQDAEVAPEVPKYAVVRAGDLWVLGDHCLLCGDATDAKDVARLLGKDKPYLMVTDPPYGVDYDADWRNRADRANGKPYGGRAIGLVTNDNRVDWAAAWKLYNGGVAYVWHADRHASSVQGSLENAGFEIVCQIVWAKNRFVISRGDYHWQHEPCWYAVRKGKRHEWSGGRSQTTLWQIAHQSSESGHSTQKPIECMKRPIENNSQPGDSVYDPFVGSGTTVIAAEMTGRKALAIEIDPGYCQVSIERWMAFTGRTATLEGASFEDVKKLRSREKAKGMRRLRKDRSGEKRRDGSAVSGV